MQSQELATLKEAAQHMAVVVASQNKLAEQLAQLVEEIRQSKSNL